MCSISFLWKIHLPSTVQKYSALTHKIWEVEGKHDRTRLFPNPIYVSRGMQRAWNTFCIEDYNNLLIDTILNKRYKGIVLICRVSRMLAWNHWSFLNRYQLKWEDWDQFMMSTCGLWTMTGTASAPFALPNWSYSLCFTWILSLSVPRGQWSSYGANLHTWHLKPVLKNRGKRQSLKWRRCCWEPIHCHIVSLVGNKMRKM